MDIKKEFNDKDLLVKLSGRLDAITSSQLKDSLKDDYDRVNHLTLDLNDLEYISSAGLRVIMSTQKSMGDKDSMNIINVQDLVMEVFEVTGFCDILNIK